MRTIYNSMQSYMLIAIVITSFNLTLPAQTAGTDDLADGLANEDTRIATIARIVASKEASLPRLLLWASQPPARVDQHGLLIGMAEVFGQLRTKEAIPFLIRHISPRRWLEMNIWMKSPQVIEQRMPAVAALIKLGPEASDAVIRAYWGPMNAQDRIAAVFVAARIGDPAARDFFGSVIGQARQEQEWAAEGLEAVKRRQ